jgi:hypothetical protein|tara:strand:+ start:219 stop:1052 length:834 start_codon:yes stop_codon:yes gene_type:complete
MATSGSTDFNSTRNEIIELANRKIGGLSDGDSLSNEQYSTGSKVLNLIAKNWSSEDIFLWKVDWVAQGLTASSAAQNNSLDYQCIRPHTSAAANEPGVGAQWESFWKALTTSAGTAWALSTSYTSINTFALDSNIISVENMRVREGTSDNILTPMSRDDYFSLGNPTIEGKPTQYYYKKEETSDVYLYPYPDSATAYIIEFMGYRYPEDFDAGANNANFLEEWLRPLVDALAVDLAPSRGIFGQQLSDLTRQASMSKSIARGTNTERGDVFFKPRFR